MKVAEDDVDKRSDDGDAVCAKSWIRLVTPKPSSNQLSRTRSSERVRVRERERTREREREGNKAKERKRKNERKKTNAEHAVCFDIEEIRTRKIELNEMLKSKSLPEIKSKRMREKHIIKKTFYIAFD